MNVCKVVQILYIEYREKGVETMAFRVLVFCFFCFELSFF